MYKDLSKKYAEVNSNDPVTKALLEAMKQVQEDNGAMTPFQMNDGFCVDIANYVEFNSGVETIELCNFNFVQDEKIWDDAFPVKCLDGNTYYWSKDMLVQYGTPPIPLEKIPDNAFSHSWIFYNGKHYDAEVINGVSSMWEIPLIRRVLEVLNTKYNKLAYNLTNMKNKLAQDLIKKHSNQELYDSLDLGDTPTRIINTEYHPIAIDKEIMNIIERQNGIGKLLEISKSKYDIGKVKLYFNRGHGFGKIIKAVPFDKTNSEQSITFLKNLKQGIINWYEDTTETTFNVNEYLRTLRDNPQERDNMMYKNNKLSIDLSKKYANDLKITASPRFNEDGSEDDFGREHNSHAEQNSSVPEVKDRMLDGKTNKYSIILQKNKKYLNDYLLSFLEQAGANDLAIVSELNALGLDRTDVEEELRQAVENIKFGDSLDVQSKKLNNNMNKVAQDIKKKYSALPSGNSPQGQMTLLLHRLTETVTAYNGNGDFNTLKQATTLSYKVYEALYNIYKAGNQQQNGNQPANIPNQGQQNWMNSNTGFGSNGNSVVPDNTEFRNAPNPVV